MIDKNRKLADRVMDVCYAIAAQPFDLRAHLAHQAQWSEATFGPGKRTAGVCDHIRKELKEIEADPTDLAEWIDVVILALDGAWRCGGTPDQIIGGIVAKQSKNEGRTWPDWRAMDPDKAIEHDRTGEVALTPGNVSDAHALLLEIDNWLVCSVIATAEDMAQSFGDFHDKIEALLNAAPVAAQGDASDATAPISDTAHRKLSLLRKYASSCGNKHESDGLLACADDVVELSRLKLYNAPVAAQGDADDEFGYVQAVPDLPSRVVDQLMPDGLYSPSPPDINLLREFAWAVQREVLARLPAAPVAPDLAGEREIIAHATYYRAPDQTRPGEWLGLRRSLTWADNKHQKLIPDDNYYLIEKIVDLVASRPQAKEKP